MSYLAPGVALFYGALFRGEAITVAAVGGLVLILARRGDRLPAHGALPPGSPRSSPYSSPAWT